MPTINNDNKNKNKKYNTLNEKFSDSVVLITYCSILTVNQKI